MSNPELFQVHLLNDVGIQKAQKLQAVFIQFLLDVETLVPGGRELAIVKTKLEEASFFAKKGMAIQKENQKA